MLFIKKPTIVTKAHLKCVADRRKEANALEFLVNATNLKEP